jgi:hypothetical protein
MSSESYQYDAFISYRRQDPDKSVARALLQALQAEGYRIAFDEVDFAPPASFLEEMERCVKQSRFVLAVISSRYFESGNTDKEATMSVVRDMRDRTHRFIPLIYEETERPDWMYSLVGLNFTDPNPVIDPFFKLKQTLGAPQHGTPGHAPVSFIATSSNRVTIQSVIAQFGASNAAHVNWDWARRLLNEKQLPDIRKRLTDTLGHDRRLMSVSFEEQLGWVGRTSLEPERQLEIDDQTTGTLDPNQLLIETVGRDDVAGKLLILGTPGSGKTTALLSLAEQLVSGALAQPQTIIPVIVELSTWRNDNQSIRDWLIEQLYDQHGGDRKAQVYERWLDQQVLLPLMDGLDELAQDKTGLERQKACTQKLKEFAQTYPRLVVCCRTKEFAQAGIKLNTLNGAIRLQPLSDQQIQTFLTQQQSPLWSVIQQSESLQQLLEPTFDGDPGLLRVPLFLTLAARVYDPDQPFKTKADLLNQYIDRQLSHEMRESDRRNDLDQKTGPTPPWTKNPSIKTPNAPSPGSLASCRPATPSNC